MPGSGIVAAMSTDVALLVFYLCLALGVSFACSIFEAVLLSITPGYVASLEKSGSAAAGRITQLKREIDRPLASILSLNTIAHTVGAAGVGAQSAKVFGSVPIAVTSGVLTVLILFVSEIVPKSLGAMHWKKLAPAVATLLVPLTWLMAVTMVLYRQMKRARMCTPTSHRQAKKARQALRPHQ